MSTDNGFDKQHTRYRKRTPGPPSLRRVVACSVRRLPSLLDEAGRRRRLPRRRLVPVGHLAPVLSRAVEVRVHPETEPPGERMLRRRAPTQRSRRGRAREESTRQPWLASYWGGPRGGGSVHLAVTCGAADPLLLVRFASDRKSTRLNSSHRT